ncbi:MAG TPA: hypothetical protein DD738_01630 [Ruminiclostridium sp.]|nr:hypothetical protein [Ruminiclostridium sp.]
MKPQNGSISSKDLIFSVFCFMQATILRSGYIISMTRNDSWIMAVTGFIFSLPIVAIYAALLRKFPGKNLIEIDEIIFGPVLGKVVSVLYLFFFLSLAALNSWDLGIFVVNFMIPDTPISAVILISLIGCVYSIRKGIENLIYLSTFIFIVAVGSMAINTILVLKDVQLEYLKPFFRLEPMKYIQGTVSVTAVPMAEVLAFTMITPMLEKDQKAGKPLLIGLVLSAASMAIVMLRDIITLGPLVSIVTLPEFEAVRYISLAEPLTRMESIYAVVLIVLLLFKVTILLYAFALGFTHMLSREKQSLPNHHITSTSSGAGQPLSQKSYPPLTLVSAALVFFYSLFVFESVMENMDWGATAAPFFSLTFAFLLPAVSLLVASLRKIDRIREVKV